MIILFPLSASFSILHDGKRGAGNGVVAALTDFTARMCHFLPPFLSWLFEGALPHFLKTPPSTNDASASTCGSGQDEVSKPMSELPSTSTRLADVEHTRSSRRGLKWSTDEDQLLVKFRKEEKLTWPEVIKRFGRVFSGRRQGAIQVYWSTNLSKRQLSLAKDSWKRRLFTDVKWQA
ncbi:hypothetical protein N7491_006458 [Penicillium cf. griseofulvum]|uniref:Myb-like domain-containing protein n=1 Tax=Penicillium cf. griseofulvum TaxID=2972120 RepID=A0A9W9IWX5_9EURO|nr:hypothetical protein N7472_010512 [Penicillium cf. griseofulvum]KAJ5429442.1 hypothetical protein N7491_006458 [Penicillium cf. griseofulvum]KAJ5436776.1 hypothetical protein N7445_007661 [Penicillium cf. griseofulvum]